MPDCHSPCRQRVRRRVAARRYRSWRTCRRERCPASAGGHGGARWRLRRHGLWCCARLWCGRYHGLGPPLPPPAQRWTLIQRLSMNSRSGAPSAPASALKISSQTPRFAGPIHLRAVGPAAPTAQRIHDPAQHPAIIQMRLAAHVGRQQGRDPLPLRIRKPKKSAISPPHHKAANHHQPPNGQPLLGPGRGDG